MTIDVFVPLMSSEICFLSMSSIPEVPFHAAILVKIANKAILVFNFVVSEMVETCLKEVFKGEDSKNLFSPANTTWTLLLSAIGSPSESFKRVIDLSVICDERIP